MMQFSLGEFNPVAEGVYVAVAEPAGVNIGLVVGPHGCLVIDTGSAPEQGAEIRRSAERKAGVPVSAVLITHWHYDHLFGLGAFTDVPSYAHRSVSAWLDREECREAARSLDVEPAALAAPTSSFALAKMIDAGGRRVEAVHLGTGHTNGDIVAVVPDVGVVFAGDLLESSGDPQFGVETDFKGWPNAVDGIVGLTTERSIIIPGHGPAMDRMAAVNQRIQLAALYDQVAQLITSGVRESAALESAEWPFTEATVAAALPLLYRHFAAAGLAPRTQLPLL